jgi:ABC-type nitrate/sulfonate/bicarbonate transport system substrate-binding protein
MSRVFAQTAVGLAVGMVLVAAAGTDSPAREPVPLTYMGLVMNPTSYSVDHYVNHYALVKGKVQPEGVKLDMKTMWVWDTTRLMTAGQGDVGAVSVNGLLLARDRGAPLVMVAAEQIVLPDPVRTTNALFARSASGVKNAKDLEGKQVGIAGRTSASAIYHTAILQHKYGVDTSKITWVDKGTPELFALLKRGDVVAATLYGGIADKAGKEPGLETLYRAPNAWKEMTGMPFLTVVVAARKSVVDKHPEALRSVLAALKASKKYGEAHKAEIMAEAAKEFGAVEDGGRIVQPFELTGEIKEVVKQYAKHCLDQQVIRKTPDFADLFADLK